MTLAPKEVIELSRDSDSDELLWREVRRFMSLLLMNPDGLGLSLGMDGPYYPTDKEVTLSTLEARFPGRYRASILAQIYDNIESLLPGQETAEEVMVGLRDGSLPLGLQLSVFAPKLADVLIEDEVDLSE